MEAHFTSLIHDQSTLYAITPTRPICRRSRHSVLSPPRKWKPVTGIEGVLLEPPRRPVKPKLLYVGVQAGKVTEEETLCLACSLATVWHPKRGSWYLL